MRNWGKGAEGRSFTSAREGGSAHIPSRVLSAGQYLTLSNTHVLRQMTDRQTNRCTRARTDTLSRPGPAATLYSFLYSSYTPTTLQETLSLLITIQGQVKGVWIGSVGDIPSQTCPCAGRKHWSSSGECYHSFIYESPTSNCS